MVRLHFKCHAQIPIGSFLRVTGSSLWAPGTAADDLADANPTAGNIEASAFPVTEEDIRSMPTQALYTSSVEMVTTPEEYPIWRTRNPVVVVIHNNKKSIQHHYYRYLVVSPGGPGHVDVGDIEVDTEEDEDTALVSTSNELTGSTPVVQWEDPFGTLKKGRGVATSTMSLTSSISNGHINSNDYRNLPYRTIDIDVKTGLPSLEEVDDEVRLDHWNTADDSSYRPYIIREAIHDENRRKLMPKLTEASTEDDVDMDAGSKNASGASTPQAFSSNNRIFFVCFHLPVVVVQNQSSGQWRASWSESILAKTEGSQILSTYEAYWVGTVTTHPPLKTEKDKEQVRKILEEMNCIPIFLEAQTLHSHYYGFCKQVLWPAFHNIDLLDLSSCGWLSDKDSGASDWDQSRLDDWWDAYVNVNQEFSNMLSDLTKPGDIVWIHDYHLSIFAQLLSNAETKQFGSPVTRKVFFLHIPFPTSQIFRELECGERILQGMLHADVVGFHAFDHARHFLNAAKRILGCNYETLVGGLIGVAFQGRTVLVSMSNVSIEPRMADAALMLPSVATTKEALKAKHEGRLIIGALDIGQRLSGVTLKLLAFERLLQDYPSWHGKVVLVQRVLFPGSRKMDENVTQGEVRALVARIRNQFGGEVIDYEEIAGSNIPMDQRLALWQASDVLMSTPIREGLNHWPMEYIFAHKAPDVPGVVIASEFSAVSSILNGALRVNPYDIQMVVSVVERALSMDMQEREGRRYRDIDFVSGSPSDKWVKNVLRDLRDATSRQPARSLSEGTSQASTPHGAVTPLQHEAINSTAAYLARESNFAFLQLSSRALYRAFSASKKRVIITDFNGTIVMKEPPGKYLKREILGTSGNKPPDEVIQALAKLCEDPRNLVYVVSGDSSENVLSAIGNIPKLGLAVSNGARFSPPMEEGQKARSWFTFDLGVDWEAVKRVAVPVLSKYTARSNGSFVKLTSFSIGWSYYSCDPEWGSLQASHLVMELANELSAYDVRFVTLKGIIEIVPRKLNKGLIVRKVLRDASAKSGEGVDFVLCMGDDISDEKMFTSTFTYMSEVGSESVANPGPPCFDDHGVYENIETLKDCRVPDEMYCFTVAVGKKTSHANFYVNDAQNVANAVVLLAEGSLPPGGVNVWDHSRHANLFE